MELKAFGLQPLRLTDLDSQEELLDACPLSASRCLVITTNSVHLVDSAARFPKSSILYLLSALSLPDGLLLAGFLQSYKSGGVLVVDMVACNADNTSAIAISLGDCNTANNAYLDMLVKQPFDQKQRCTMRISDTLIVRQDLEENKIYLLDGKEHLLMNVERGEIVTRRCVYLFEKNTIFIAVAKRLFKFNLHRLEFVVEFSERIQCISSFALDYISVLTIDGKLMVCNAHTGFSLLSSNLILDSTERLKSCVGNIHGVFVITSSRLFQLLIGTSKDEAGSFFMPFFDRIFIDSYNSVQVPKEYFYATGVLPIRNSVVYKGRMAISGQYGLCLSRQIREKSKWVILHPDPAELRVCINSMSFIDEDLLVVTCSVQSRTSKRFELRIYTVSSHPISIAARLQLAHPDCCLFVARDEEKKVCIVDENGRLSLVECGLNGWTEGASAQLQSVENIRRVLYTSSVFYVLKDNTVYSIKLSAISDNPVNCTVASIWEGGEDCRVEDVYKLQFGIIAALVCKFEWVATFRFDERYLCSIPLPVQVIDISHKYLTTSDAVRIPVLPHIICSALKEPSLSSLAKNLKHDAMELLEPCLFQCWMENVLTDFLFLISDGLEVQRNIKLGISRVARTLEYRQAVGFVSACGYSLRDLFTWFAEANCADGLLLIFKLCLEEDGIDWLTPIARMLLDSYRLDDLSQLYQLSERLGLDVSKCKALILQSQQTALQRLNLPDLRQLCAILPEGIAELPINDENQNGGETRERIAAVAASVLIDPDIVNWAEGIPTLQRDVALLQSLSNKLDPKGR